MKYSMRNTPSTQLFSLLKWSEKYFKTDMFYLLRTGFWGNAGVATSSLFGLVLYVIFGHFLSPEEYGMYQYLLTLSVFINALTLTGMNTAVTRSVARGYSGSLYAAVRYQLLLGLIPFVFGVGFSIYFAISGNFAISIGVLIMSIAIPLVNSFNTYAAFLTGKLDVRRAFLYNFAGNVPYYAGIGLSAVYFKEALPILFVNMVLGTIVSYVAYKRTLKRVDNIAASEPGVTRYGTHLSLMNIPLIILGSLDNLLAFHFLGAAGLAIYSFSTAIPDQVGKLMKFLPAAALPKFSLNESASFGISLKRKIIQVFCVSLFLTIAYFLLAPYIFTYLFPKYTEAIPYSKLYALIILSLGTGLVTTALMAKERLRELYIFNISSGVIQTVLQLIGIFFWGLTGLIVGKVVSSQIALFISIFLFFKRKSIPSINLPSEEKV
ncbi:oligosaccharide flippase family protein [Patescibacteria group bacterium]|nr:oligosaccharide flippase family protein [Patescibacteria group bacterium]MBU1501119.1 oligosaccharide flippase family protein [Patescibacteria group bacterium]MBU2081008.1 oligosaccharide flippase family protein [Patescibacteria group bacterium]MBU2194955.1 oligosaccharide flippase family protein [Patescibacteria group bacterium]